MECKTVFGAIGGYEAKIDNFAAILLKCIVYHLYIFRSLQHVVWFHIFMQVVPLSLFSSNFIVLKRKSTSLVQFPSNV